MKSLFAVELLNREIIVFLSIFARHPCVSLTAVSQMDQFCHCCVLYMYLFPFNNSRDLLLKFTEQWLPGKTGQDSSLEAASCFQAQNATFACKQV